MTPTTSRPSGDHSRTGGTPTNVLTAFQVVVPVPVSHQGAKTLGRVCEAMLRARLMSKEDLLAVVSGLISTSGGTLLFKSFCDGYTHPDT